MSIKSGDDFCAYVLVCTNNVSEVLRIELPRQSRRIHYIAEHDGELPSFGVCHRRDRRRFHLRR